MVESITTDKEPMSEKDIKHLIQKCEMSIFEGLRYIAITKLYNGRHTKYEEDIWKRIESTRRILHIFYTNRNALIGEKSGINISFPYERTDYLTDMHYTLVSRLHEISRTRYLKLKKEGKLLLLINREISRIMHNLIKYYSDQIRLSKSVFGEAEGMIGPVNALFMGPILSHGVRGKRND